MKITISDMRAGDIDGVLAIEGNIGAHAKALTFSGPIADYLGRGQGIACLARAEDGIVGLVMGRLVNPFPGCQKGAWVEVVGIASELRHRGIGTRLFRAFERRCHKKGCTCIHALASGSDTAMKSFFESVGLGAGKQVKFDKQL